MNAENAGNGELKFQIQRVIEDFKRTYDEIGTVREITRYEDLDEPIINKESQLSQTKKPVKENVEVRHTGLYDLYRDIQETLDFSGHISNVGKTYELFGDGKQKDTAIGVFGNYVVDGFFKYLESDLLSGKITKSVEQKNKRKSKYNFEKISEYLNSEMDLLEKRKMEIILLPTESSKENIEKINEQLDSTYVEMVKQLKDTEPEITEKEVRTYNTSKLVREYFSFLESMPKYRRLQLPFRDGVNNMTKNLGRRLEKLDNENYFVTQILNTFNQKSKNYFK